MIAVEAPGDWVDEALCAQIGGDAWFPELGGASKPAQTVCGECPVRDECLNYAIRNNISDGIWGGLSPNARTRLRNKDNAA